MAAPTTRTPTIPRAIPIASDLPELCGVLAAEDVGSDVDVDVNETFTDVDGNIVIDWDVEKNECDMAIITFQN